MPEPPKRQPSRTSITVDAVVGAARGAGESLDHVRPELARRNQTLNGLGVKPSPPVPPAPGLPLEHQKTQRAPAIYRPGPTTHAPGTLPPRPAVIVGAYDLPGAAATGAASEAPRSTPLPPPSSTPDEASARARDRARDKALAELERERRERQKLELQLEIERERAKKSEPPAKPWIDERLVKALVALLGALTALGTPLGIWLTAKATAAEAERARAERSAKEATATATSAKAESATGAKELDELRKQLAAERAYNREVLRRMGVSIPKRPGDPDPPQLDVEVPLRKPGTVTPGVVLTVKTPPP